MRKRNRCTIAAIITAVTILAGASPILAESPPEGTPLPTVRPSGNESSTDAVSGATVQEGSTQQGAEPQGDTPPDAVSGATPGGGQKIQPKFLGMNVSLKAHKATGYIAGGLFAAASVVGLYRFLDLRERGHQYRDNEGEGEEDAVSSASIQSCDPYITKAWESGQAVRWTHVGLVVAGESLYLFDAVTGISMIPKNGKGSRAGTIHRNAFFVHAGLMAAEVILGFLETNALKKGNHDEVVGYGAAHLGIGFAIPIVIIGSGLAIDLYPDLK